jgi:hypothetical protein
VNLDFDHIQLVGVSAHENADTVSATAAPWGMFVCESGKSDADPGYDCLAAAQQALAIPIGWI